MPNQSSANTKVKVVIEYEIDQGSLQALDTINLYLVDKSPAFIPQEKLLSDCQLREIDLIELIAKEVISGSTTEWENGPSYFFIYVTSLGRKVLSGRREAKP